MSFDAMPLEIINTLARQTNWSHSTAAEKDLAEQGSCKKNSGPSTFEFDEHSAAVFIFMSSVVS
jgi:hypothetical protein